MNDAKGTGEKRPQPSLHEALGALRAAYGLDQVKAASEVVLGKIEVSRQVPAEYIRILHPTELHHTITSLDESVNAVLHANDAREKAYGNKALLAEEKAKLQTEIQLIEATALMNDVTPDGKHGKIDGKTVPLNNAEQRDAFRRMTSAGQRKRLAEVEGQLQALEIELLKARDGWEAALQAAESVRSRAHAQARLLQFLAGGM